MPLTCIYFQRQGYCRDGGECRYSHDSGPADKRPRALQVKSWRRPSLDSTNVPEAPVVIPMPRRFSSPNGAGAVPMSALSNTRVARASTSPIDNNESVNSRPPPLRVSRMQRPCQYFNRPSGCLSGDRCPFDHTRTTEAGRLPTSPTTFHCSKKEDCAYHKTGQFAEGRSGPFNAIHFLSDGGDLILGVTTDTPASPTSSTATGRSEETLIESPILRVTPDGPAEEFTRLIEALLAHGATELKELKDLKEAGWKASKLDMHYAAQRGAADTQIQALRDKNNMFFYDGMFHVFEEFNKALDVIPIHRPIKFLDLGCAPGGFSNYVLKCNHLGQGFGVSLPVAEGGHECIIPCGPDSRHNLVWGNLTAYDLRPEDKRHLPVPPRASQGAVSSQPDLLPFPFAKNDFDLVILDGHKLRTHVQSDITRDWDWTRLLISQLIISLEAVKHGGTLVVKLSRPEIGITATMLYMLDKLAEGKLQTFKPTVLHKDRGTFYVVAKNIQREDNALYNHFVHELKHSWWEATYGGEEGRGEPPRENAWDAIVTIDTLCTEFVNRLIELGRPVWKAQAKGLRYLHLRKGVNNSV